MPTGFEPVQPHDQDDERAVHTEHQNVDKVPVARVLLFSIAGALAAAYVIVVATEAYVYLPAATDQPQLAPAAPLPLQPPFTPLAQVMEAGGPLHLAPFPPPASSVAIQRRTEPLWRLLGGSSPAETASLLVRHNLTFDEKLGLLRGFGWGPGKYEKHAGVYVGNVAGIPRLHIPSQNSQDAAQGFRTTDARHIGQVTSFPSALAAAATWDAALVHQWAASIGAEFRAKGANVILGPSVNVHRVARGGRNGEYLSGEDGALGAPLAAAYVRGVQSMGVAAVVKHWVLNSQETNRNTQSSDVDDRTLFEVYYPPFRAAIDAGVASVMCSYNQLNGSWACGGTNDRWIVKHLRGKLGFDGFVMSDWWATHGTEAALHGVDQEMPGNYGHFEESKLRRLGADVDSMAQRVLTGMLKSGAFDEASQRTGSCEPRGECNFLLYQARPTGEAHAAVALKVASASVVLLKNAERVLPLRRGVRVALLGSACNAPFVTEMGRWDESDYYTVGGSGHVAPSADQSYTIQEALDERLDASDLKELRIFPFDHASKALDEARGYDIAIACGGTAAAEGADRKSLHLDQDAFLNTLAWSSMRARQRDLQRGVAASTRTPPLVVIALAPGAILARWAEPADAALIAFLTGQETGRAIANVLFGDVNPSARLPVSIPDSEHDVLAPCTSPRCEYTERLRVGWRGLIGRPVTFPFGHGETFSSFVYSWASVPAEHARGSSDNPQSVAIRLQIRVRNTGQRAGSEVAQCYLQYPESASEPELVLRGFKKTPLLQPGESTELSFDILSEGVSVWNASADGAWQLVHGKFMALMGSSSRNFTLSHTFIV